MPKPETLDFEALEEFRNYLASLRRNHVPTMNHYASEDGKGFWHQPSNRQAASLSSTATCISSLFRAGLWKHNERKWGATQDVAKRLLQKPWKSAVGLKDNNPFGLSFIVEGILDLIEVEKYDGCEEDRGIVLNEIVPILIGEVRDAKEPLAVSGSVCIPPYPPSAYLTQLAFRVLKRCCTDETEDYKDVVRGVRAWARSEIHRQVALISTRSRIADPLQLAYAIILAFSASEDEQTSPEEKALTRGALKIFFDNQQPDGTWPPSQPLFHYPDVGNAQCFDYELLTQLLSCEQLQDELLQQFLPQLQLVAFQLRHASFDLGITKVGPAVGWASGHHPQIAGPESWSTACVYHFVHALDRLVAEGIRRALFAELRTVYTAPVRITKKPDFAPYFLDANVKPGDDVLSLRDTLRDKFVLPIDHEKTVVANGGSLAQTTPMSAILFGPPGTSKTQLAKHISNYLGWPLLSVDPSYLVQDGLENLYARANRLFSMFAMVEQIVVFLDEFDEMGRDRTQSQDLLSRLITTSMLPKLAAINDERKIVFLLATNHVSNFDAAFSRGGRFDMVLQVMPPTTDAKLGFPEWASVLKRALAEFKGKKAAAEVNECLEDLTYLETQQLVFVLGRQPEDVFEVFKKARASGTLMRKNGEQTWKETCEKDRAQIRLPPV
jgi:ATPase family associated with various cellular activities (AAA)